MAGSCVPSRFGVIACPMPLYFAFPATDVTVHRVAALCARGQPE